VGMEALAARVPFVFPIDGGFFIFGGRTRDAPHPDLLKRVGVRWQRDEHERKRSKPYSRNEHSTLHQHKRTGGRPMVNAWAIILAVTCSNLALRWAAAGHNCNSQAN